MLRAAALRQRVPLAPLGWYSSLIPTWRKDNFLLLRVEGRDGVLLFHQELGGESIPCLENNNHCGTENINNLKKVTK